MIEVVKKILDLYLDEYLGLAGVSFFDLPIYKREIIVGTRDRLAHQICRLFPKSLDNPDGYKPKPDESDKESQEFWKKEGVK